jgi:DNA-directed RNA polymerase subunit beta
VLEVIQPTRRQRLSFAKTHEVLEVPNLLDIQKESFEWLKKDGLAETFRDVYPIEDFSKKFALEFREHEFGEVKIGVDECKERDTTYSAPLYVHARFTNKETGEMKEQKVFMGDFPFMTDKGTFVINGTERVVVSQLVRSPGVYYDREIDKLTDKQLFSCKVIPSRGAWIELEIDKRDVVYVRIDRKRKQLITIFLKALGMTTEQIKSTFTSITDKESTADCILKTLEKDDIESHDQALIEIYKKIRPGEPPTLESARNLIDSLFFNSKRYDLGKVGRYKLNKKLNLDTSEDQYTLDMRDIIEIINYLVGLHYGVGDTDDIDHFGNRRIRAVGELIQNQFRTGLSRMERVVRERMTTQDADTITPQSLINIRPVVASLKEFYGSSQLSQFMDQTNPLSGLTHKRRLSALGPGGLSRERAGFEVRDVHPSHYGRMCPIETPEGPNIGLIGSLATYGRVNKLGFIETPFRIVNNGVLTNEVVYLTADDEDEYRIAEANELVDENGRFLSDKFLVRYRGEVEIIDAIRVDMVDISPKQMVSVATSLIPFLEHDDANRALMGSNMQRQAVPLIKPESPLIGTGTEYRAAIDSGEVLLAEEGGVARRVCADFIDVEYKKSGLVRHKLHKFERSNQGTCINQKPIVNSGNVVKAGEPLADGPCTDHGELSLGRNLLVAFIPWEGYNFEDAIIVSEKLVEEDILTSIHIEKHEIEARSTKLGHEEITRDIPNVSEELLKDLDERGVIRTGAEVQPGDILVGKVTPKGETELTAEERLLRAIFGEKAREVRDTSLKVPHGETGKVIDVKVFSREAGDELSPGVNELIRIYVAQKRKVQEGDKLAGRHGNKGVISRVLPEEDMPYLLDGTPVDVILNPLGVPSRMNIGQILEAHLGLAAMSSYNGNGSSNDGAPTYISSPVFDGAKEKEICDLLVKAGYSETGKMYLIDGRTGEIFDHKITVGYIYIMKLSHLVDDKIHARSTGPYSLITQQPLGGKAQFGGQRFGEMEVWALEAYGAASMLQEMLTVKSDDVFGRVKTYESIVKGENIERPGIPESFKVLIKEMQSLGLNIEVTSGDGKQIDIKTDEDDIMRSIEDFGMSFSKGDLSISDEPLDEKK